jgi:hypothetical protein
MDSEYFTLRNVCAESEKTNVIKVTLCVSALVLVYSFAFWHSFTAGNRAAADQNCQAARGGGRFDLC